MVFETKQTTFVIIDEKPEWHGDNGGSDTPNDSTSDNGGNNNQNSNSYWDIPFRPDNTDTVISVPETDPPSTNSNPYWEIPLQPLTPIELEQEEAMADIEEDTTTDEPPTTTNTTADTETEGITNTTVVSQNTTETISPEEETAETNTTTMSPSDSANTTASTTTISPSSDASNLNTTTTPASGSSSSEATPPPSPDSSSTSSSSSSATTTTTTPAITNTGEGILSSIRFYQQLRQQVPQDFVKPIDAATNVEIFTGAAPLIGDTQLAFCHLPAILPFTQADEIPSQLAHEDAVALALAVQDLNAGNGILIPEVAGYNERCPIRFTTEWFDTEFQGGVALGHVVDLINRESQGPCAFLGAWRSAVSMPTSIVTGLFGFPQISAGSTSADLDDSSQYPLFGRTIPSDAGNAIPIVLFMHHVLQIQHLAVINVNDAYGNAYVEGLRNAAAIHSPNLKIHQVPLDDDGEASVQAAVASVKSTTYRYVFMIVFTPATHDKILAEAYKEGVAGDGQHTWLYGDSFLGVLDGRTFPVGGPLHQSYRGSGLLEVTGGVPGMVKFDQFLDHFTSLDNPIDRATIGELFPKHPNYPTYDPEKYVTGDHESFLKTVTSGFAPFMYEAVVGLGLAACDAANQAESLEFTGQAHFDAFKNSSFEAFSGPIKIDPETGTRDPASALYKVTNYQEQFETDPETGEDVVRFVAVNTHLFQGGVWVQQPNVEYLFNDGTPNIPADLPPAIDPNAANDGSGIALSVIIPLAVIAILGVVVFLFYENKRKKNDSVWVVDKNDIQFADPPEIIGRGTFGLVLLGEYRGTQVAIKRVIPPKNQKLEAESNHSTGSPGMRSGVASLRGSASGLGMASGLNANSAHGNSKNDWAGMSMLGSMVPKNARKKNFGFKQSEAAQWKALKAEFLEEMRYLSKLRHPCITTVMGAVTKGEPMLIMEYMDHGSLYDLLHNETMALEGELLLPLIRDITQGMRFLHASDPAVIHGDLKAANILVDSRYRGKVADFGLSQKQNMGGTGTPFWMAPELLRGESANTVASDIYSFGIILYEVFSRRDPYDGEDAEEVLKLVADQKVRKRPPTPLHMPESVKALMKDCLDDDANNRPSCEEVDTRLKRIDAEAIDSNQNKKSSQVSLFDIFPRHIAEALRDGRTVEPEHKDSVTIFFSDIVGFTTISSELEPRKVANMLDRLYTKFDSLSQKHDIFKVETIGDAYMAVTNLVKEQDDDHARRIADFAIEAIEAANNTRIDDEDEEKGCVNIRVGFHSGPVVADVVGTRNPRYCLFGDTVNTASRMESNSEENRIHCSRAAAKLLQKQHKDLPMKSRGKVKIKGKGEMQTYWVNEGVGGKRLSSVDFIDASVRMSGSLRDDSTRDDSENYFPILSDRKISAVEEASGEFGSDLSDSLKETAPLKRTEQVMEPTPFGAAGEDL